LIHWFINSLIYLFIYVEYAESTLKYVKTRISKLSKISHIVIAFSRHKKESQMDTIVTVTMRYLGSYIELCVAQDYLILRRTVCSVDYVESYIARCEATIKDSKCFFSEMSLVCFIIIFLQRMSFEMEKLWKLSSYLLKECSNLYLKSSFIFIFDHF
jgi:hypothetical protein